jgi:adenine-specific DNA-methyltransferase
MSVRVGNFALRYKDVSKEKADGATFTPKKLADFVARHIVSGMEQSPHKKLRVLDPAVGEGSLLLSLIQELETHGYKNIEVHGFDTNAASLAIAERAIREEYPRHEIKFRARDFLEVAGRFIDAPLFADVTADDDGKFDLVIANPPYIRTQIMGASSAQAIAAHFGLTGRVDTYHAFILGIIKVLTEDGIAGVIASNRFMTTKSGAAVRKILRTTVQLDDIWDLGDTRLFTAAVLPAVIRMRKSEAAGRAPGFTSIYETVGAVDCEAADVIDALSKSGVVSIEDGRRFKVTSGTLDLSKGIEDVWRVATDETDAWLATVKEHTWRTFGEIGSIRVGIKTCADNVFISSKWSSVPEAERPELLRSLTTHHMGRRFRPDPSVALRHVVYPHKVNDQGKREAVNLAHYPRSAAYFEEHRAVLSERSYISGAGRNWYEIWVPQDPEMWERPKLVFRDISEKPTFWIDLDGSVVNGDCYWLALEKAADLNLLWLALAVSNSSFIETFYDHRFNNKLYAGRRRFITQYVEAFPLPDPALATSRALIRIAKEIYEKTPSASALGLEAELDALVAVAFGVGVLEEVVR